MPAKPTIRLLYYLLGGIAHHWMQLGLHLKFRISELEKIRCEFNDSDQRMIELFDLWIERCDHDCSWSAIIKALHEMKETSLAENVSQYTEELARTEKFSSLHDQYCRNLVPLKEYCYEDAELKKRCFEPDKLSRMLDGNAQVYIIECLTPRRIYWYKIGILLDVPKPKLDTIRKEEEQLGFFTAMSEMIEALLDSYKCTWRKIVGDEL